MKPSDPVLPPRIRNFVERYAADAAAECKRLDSCFFDQFADARDWRDQLALLETYCLSRYDLFAEWTLFLSVSHDSALVNPLYEKCLDRFVEEKLSPFLVEALKPLRSDLRDEFVSRTELKLIGRKFNWLAKANTAQSLRHQPHAGVDSTQYRKSSPKTQQPRASRVPPKSLDLSSIFADAKLAPRQMEIAALAWERGMRRAAIARHLGLNWNTVDESLASAKRRIDAANVRRKMVRGPRNPDS